MVYEDAFDWMGDAICRGAACVWGPVAIRERMKKYLSVLVPFVFCSGLALFFAFSEPNPDAVFGDRPTYDWLSNLWFLIGIVISTMTLLALLIDDVFSYWDHSREMRRLRRPKR